MAGRTKEQIKQGNDLLRDTFLGIFGKVVLSEGVKFSPAREDILTAVREFKNFNESNDPHGEHDFASFEVEDPEGDFCDQRKKSFTKGIFKIDYYTPDYSCGADPYTQPFRRVLTIMLANEY